MKGLCDGARLCHVPASPLIQGRCELYHPSASCVVLPAFDTGLAAVINPVVEEARGPCLCHPYPVLPWAEPDIATVQQLHALPHSIRLGPPVILKGAGSLFIIKGYLEICPYKQTQKVEKTTQRLSFPHMVAWCVQGQSIIAVTANRDFSVFAALKETKQQARGGTRALFPHSIRSPPKLGKCQHVRRTIWSILVASTEGAPSHPRTGCLGCSNRASSASQHPSTECATGRVKAQAYFSSKYLTFWSDSFSPCLPLPWIITLALHLCNHFHSNRGRPHKHGIFWVKLRIWMADAHLTESKRTGFYNTTEQ